MFIPGFARKTARPVTAVILSSFLLTSCAGVTGNVQSILPGGYLSNKDDACYAERKQLDASGNTFETELVRNVAAGALIGGIGAAVTGRNVLAGAAIGAVAGAAGTYLYDLWRKNNGDGDLTARQSIKRVNEENEQLDKISRALDHIIECRKNEAKEVRAKLRKRIITRPQAEEMMKEVRMKYREDMAHAKKIADNVLTRSSENVAIYNRLAADNDQVGLEEAPTRSGVKVTKRPPKDVGAPEGQERIIVEDEKLIKDTRKVVTSNSTKSREVERKVEQGEAAEDSFTLG